MFQYSAVLMPIVAAAFIEALSRRRDRQRPPARPTQPTRLRRLPHLWRTSIFPPLLVGLIVTAVLLPAYPLAKLAHPGEWTTPPRIAAARTLLQRIPNGATVSASNTLIPQLTDRTTVYLFRPTTLDSVTWIIIDTQSVNTFPLSQAAYAQLITTAEHTGFQVIANQDGYVLLHR
jgi:hypothetical protein